MKHGNKKLYAKNKIYAYKSVWVNSEKSEAKFSYQKAVSPKIAYGKC